MRAERTMASPLSLSDGELAAEIRRLARSERESTASLVAHLAEFDARRLYLGAGFPSLFMYCTEVLRLSEHEAYNRIEAARVARSFPRVIEMVGEGALNLTTVRLVAPHLTSENQEQVLAEASGKSKREVAELVVRYAPKPAVPASIRRIPAAKSMPPSLLGAGPLLADLSTVRVAAGLDEGEASQASAVDPSSTNPLQAAAPATTTRREIVRPLAPDRYEIRFTATAQTCEKLRLATDLLRHAVPDGDMAAVVDRALTLLLDDLARKKCATTPCPRSDAKQDGRSGRSDGRYIPAPVKRAVWLRDGGRCAFAGTGARRCQERGYLEFHHVRPYAVGGAATADNIQIRCRAHNAYEADLFYGRSEREGAVPDGARVTNSLRNELVEQDGATP